MTDHAPAQHHPAASSVKLDEAITLLNEAARDKRSELQALFHEKASDLRAVIQTASDDSLGRIRRMGEAVSDRAKATVTSVDTEVHRNPWPYIGGAALSALIAGYALGRRRGSHREEA